MKTRANFFLSCVGLMSLGLTAVSVFAQTPVMPPAKREASLSQIGAVLGRKDAPLVDKLPDPFHSLPFAEVFGQAVAGPNPPLGANPIGSTSDGAAAPRPSGPRTDRDIIAGIAASLKPGGYIVLGGQPSLSFGQKRVKPGGVLKITFEGTEYTVEITAIDRTNFTLRLNREEYTRPIK